MDDVPTCRLDAPARKVMIEKLYRAKRVGSPTVITDFSIWMIDGEQIYSIIWIQGRVTKVQEDASRFSLDDKTSLAVIDYSNVPVGCLKPQIDRYMMVIGELVDVCPHPLVKAMKIQDLSDQYQAQLIWPLEVEDSDRFLTSPHR